ncbi:hypothetical protein [Salinisphaera orenii]|nr:hypothetical protein [Salinisphaera halophila]
MTRSNRMARASARTSRPPLRFDLRTLPRLMYLATLCLTVMGAGIVAAKMLYRPDGVYGLYALVDLNGDSSVPTWYAAFTLLLCAGLLALHGHYSRQRGDANAFHWRLLAWVFALMSVDEVARIHEVVGSFLGAQIKPAVGELNGFFHFDWVAAGVVFTLIVALFYIPFLLRLPRRVAGGLMLAGAIFVGGALVVEIFNARTQYLFDVHSVYYQMGTVVEECLEMLGVAVFADVLIRHLADYTKNTDIEVLFTISDFDGPGDSRQAEDRDVRGE